MRLCRGTLVLFTLWLSGCQSTTPASRDDRNGTTSDDAVGDRGPPFTAAEIRAATKGGRRFVYAVTGHDTRAHLHVIHFVKLTDAGATTSTVDFDVNLAPLEVARATTTTWEGFVEHARFPPAATVRRPGTVSVPAGDFAGPHYEVRAPGGTAPTTTRVMFAESLPGPPARMDVTVGRQVTMRMVLVDHHPRTAQTRADPDPALAPFTFLVGRWRLTRDDEIIDETWFAPLGAALTGVAVASGPDGAHHRYETMQVRVDDDGRVRFHAWPDGQAHAAFDLVDVTNRSAHFANPAHDFPQVVRYVRPDVGLTAVVEKVDGTGRVSFAYAPVP